MEKVLKTKGVRFIRKLTDAKQVATEVKTLPRELGHYTSAQNLRSVEVTGKRGPWIYDPQKGADGGGYVTMQRIGRIIDEADDHSVTNVYEHKGHSLVLGRCNAYIINLSTLRVGYRFDEIPEEMR